MLLGKTKSNSVITVRSGSFTLQSYRTSKAMINKPAYLILYGDKECRTG
jgi:hypothetical protein